MSSKYKLIAADLDGTLRPERAQFSERVKSAVARAVQAGVHFVIATGRMYRTAKPFAEELGLKDVIVCSQGASIRDLASETVLWEKRIAPDLAIQVARYVSPELTLLACLDEKIFTTRLSDDALAFAGKYLDHLQCVPGWEDCLAAGAEKLVFANQPEVTSKLLLQLKSQFGHDLQVVQSFPRYVELTHKDVSKGKAVAWLVERWGIGREEVLAIGDQDNDLSMVKWAGLGIAMGNAVEGLKSVARHITLRADEDGAAVAIEQFVLEGCDQD